MSQQKRARIEIALVLFAFWLPSLATATNDLLGGRSAEFLTPTVFAFISAFALQCGHLLILLLLIWSAGRKFFAFRIVRPKPRDIGVGLGIFALMVVSWIAYAYLVRQLGVTGVFTRKASNHFPLAEGVIWMTCSVIYEELFYRSFLPTRLKYLGWDSAVIVTFTSLLFAAVHIYQGIGVLPIIFLFGCILGAAARHFKSIWPGLIGHWTYDFYVIFFPVVWRALVKHP